MKKVSIFALLFLLLLAACTAPAKETSGDYKKISAEEAKSKMEVEQGCILLDVRSVEEFDSSHIEGAIVIPHDEIATRAATELPLKTALILVYCQSGRRSKEAAESLCRMGYTNVCDFGGMNDWPYEAVTVKE